MKSYKEEYKKWLENVKDIDLLQELKSMDEAVIEDAFYRNLAFGTGGLRGIIGAGTNRMNVYVVAKASQGLANYLLNSVILHAKTQDQAQDQACKDDQDEQGKRLSLVIGYDSRIKSDIFAKVAASVFAANNITVHFWPELNPVPTVSYAVRQLHASVGIMITASHNPAQYNGYKVYGSDGCQITIDMAGKVLNEIERLDIFNDVKETDFDEAVKDGKIKYIEESILTSFIEEIKNQSVLFGDGINHDVSIVYSPLNGTGLIPVTRAFSEAGFTNIKIVEEQKVPDGNFPTCPYPNPEIREAMELGLEYCKKTGADLLIATDPDCDRCGIAVNNSSGDYILLSGNEVGCLLLDYVCSQRTKHNRMPEHPVFIKTIVTTDLAEKIATHYGVKTVNVLTGFKFIGEQIGLLEKEGRESDYICGFEESYGYLTGSYVRDKDGVNAAFMICEMFAFYKTQGISLLEKLELLYVQYGYCLNTLHSYDFPGSAGMEKMSEIMNTLREESSNIFAGQNLLQIIDYNNGIDNLPLSNVLKFYFVNDSSVVIRPSGTEPKLKAYISIISDDKITAGITEKRIVDAIEGINIVNKNANMSWISQIFPDYEIVLEYDNVENKNPKEEIHGLAKSATDILCQFCHRPYSNWTKKDIAHAISECLGNKRLINACECYDCNHIFGEIAENHLGKFIMPYRFIGQIYGKGKQRNVIRDGKHDSEAFRTFRFEQKKNVPVFKSERFDVNSLLLEVKGEGGRLEFTDYGFKLSIPRQLYDPRMVYASLLKIFYTLVPCVKQLNEQSLLFGHEFSNYVRGQIRLYLALSKKPIFSPGNKVSCQALSESDIEKYLSGLPNKGIELRYAKKDVPDGVNVCLLRRKFATHNSDTHNNRTVIEPRFLFAIQLKWYTIVIPAISDIIAAPPVCDIENIANKDDVIFSNIPYSYNVRCTPTSEITVRTLDFTKVETEFICEMQAEKIDIPEELYGELAEDLRKAGLLKKSSSE